MSEFVQRISCNTNAICATQMHATQGIKLLGDRALHVMADEYAQLDKLDVFKPRYASTMSSTDKQRALRTIDLIKIK